MHGAIRDKWALLGWENGLLGFPVTDELGTPDGVGRYSHFQGGSIYWTPQTGAWEVHGAIWDLWASLGWEQSFLGYPVGDESAFPINNGRYSDFPIRFEVQPEKTTNQKIDVYSGAGDKGTVYLAVTNTAV